jgi:hypothetical protein
MCKALTKKDKKCKNKAIHDSDYCRVHQKHVDPDVKIFESQCMFMLDNGRQCKNKPKECSFTNLKEDYCTIHYGFIERQKEEEKRKEIIKKYNNILNKILIYKNYVLTNDEVNDVIMMSDHINNMGDMNRIIFLGDMNEDEIIKEKFEIFNLGIECERIIKEYKYLIIKKFGEKFEIEYNEMIALCNRLKNAYDTYDNIYHHCQTDWNILVNKISKILVDNYSHLNDINILHEMCIAFFIHKLKTEQWNTIKQVIGCYNNITKRKNEKINEWEKLNMDKLRIKELKNCSVVCDDLSEYIIKKYL